MGWSWKWNSMNVVTISAAACGAIKNRGINYYKLQWVLVHFCFQELEHLFFNCEW
jgi:hypothetical protein